MGRQVKQLDNLTHDVSKKMLTHTIPTIIQ